MSDLYEQNRRSWNAVTPAHNSHKRDQAAFLRQGGTTLFPEEVELLGDIRGQQLVHLQCNCGQDTLSLVQLGATLTGVDLSDEAVSHARGLSEATGLDATFVRSDLYSWFDDSEPARFDTVFTSYGTVGWLDDLTRWAHGVAHVLRPGGRLVFIDFHPLVWSLGPSPTSYFLQGVIEEEGGVRDYVGKDLAPSGYEPGISDFANPHDAKCFQWTVADHIQALIDAGLHLETMREYPFTNGCEVFDGMRPLPERRYTMPEGQPEMPLMLALVARRPVPPPPANEM